MEDVLELYAEPYDAKRPKVNFDESSKQLIKESRQPLAAQAGQPARFDYELVASLASTKDAHIDHGVGH